MVGTSQGHLPAQPSQGPTWTGCCWALPVTKDQACRQQRPKARHQGARAEAWLPPLMAPLGGEVLVSGSRPGCCCLPLTPTL